MFSEGFDDYSTASCRLENGVVTVKTACAEVGQGFVTLVRQIVHEILGVDDVVLAPVDTDIGSAGSTSASRQTWMSGGAVQAACNAVLRRIDDGATGVIEEEVTFRHAVTAPLDGDGQGDAHVSFAFAAHRAVVDVDPELGLVRVVDMTTAQDVGRVLNPLQVVGQIEGGTLQGVGLAVMEEMKLSGGKVLNPTFTDYLIPTALDAPEVRIAALIEEPEPGAPFGAKGVGEPPTLSSTPAVAAAIRAATGRTLPRVPIRPEDICL
jgi:CO/xanthine dehydrogenase Mo-binding subunit